MAKLLEFDYKELKNFKEELKDLTKEGEQFFHEAITNIAHRAIAKIKKRTPVDTGILRNAWRISMCRKVGNQYLAVIVNETSYAEYVEYGHRIGGGSKRFGKNKLKRSKKKKLKVKYSIDKAKVSKGFVKGRFMMTISMWEIEKEMDKIVQLEFEKWLKSRIVK